MMKVFGSVPIELWVNLLRTIRDILDCVVKSTENNQ